MNKLFLAASAAALLTAAGTMPSLAQSSSSSASTMTMPSITCRDLSGMDQQTARNVVFYLSGLHAATSSSAMNSTTGSGSSSTSADAGSTGTSGSSAAGSSSTTADAGSSGSSTTTGSSDTTASGSTGTSTDTTGSTTAAGSSGSSDTSSSSAGSSGDSGAVMAQLPGFSMINADQIISTCQSSPDKQLSDVLGTGSAAQ